MAVRVSDAIHVDRALARRILGGDETAFRGLFDSFFPRLYRFALARLNGDHEAAREVVQRTFCKAIERLDTYRGEAALYTWFCQVCRNALIDYQRAMNREARTVVLLEDQPNLRAVLEAFVAPASAQPELAAWQQDVRRLVQATVDTLPDHYSAILEWKYVDGRSVDEIARQLNVGVKAAESLLTRARHAFREAIMALAETPDALRPPSEGG
ncbi:MAG TPA: sigma-70 family RNA polymerase sigma factor [Steroidobacteraceae bacterium]